MTWNSTGETCHLRHTKFWKQRIWPGQLALVEQLNLITEIQGDERFSRCLKDVTQNGTV